jgi:hypothetical protein
MSLIHQHKEGINQLGFKVYHCCLRYAGHVLEADMKPAPTLLKQVARYSKLCYDSGKTWQHALQHVRNICLSYTSTLTFTSSLSTTTNLSYLDPCTIFTQMQEEGFPLNLVFFYMRGCLKFAYAVLNQTTLCIQCRCFIFGGSSLIWINTFSLGRCVLFGGRFRLEASCIRTNTVTELAIQIDKPW